MKTILKIEDLEIRELFDLSEDQSKKCFVVFIEDGLKRSYPLPSFGSIEKFGEWVYSGKLTYRSETVDSEVYYIYAAREIHIYPK